MENFWYYLKLNLILHGIDFVVGIVGLFVINPLFGGGVWYCDACRRANGDTMTKKFKAELAAAVKVHRVAYYSGKRKEALES